MIVVADAGPILYLLRIGTAVAHMAGVLVFEQKISQFRQTNFYLSDDLVARVCRDIARSENRSATEASAH